MGGAAFCQEYVALLEAIRDALVGIDDEPMTRCGPWPNGQSRGS